MEINQDDWRLFNQDKYLCGKTLKKASFIASPIGRDHAHCEFCWNKFSDNSDDLHEGYVTLDNRYWICAECYNDFKEMFLWDMTE